MSEDTTKNPFNGKAERWQHNYDLFKNYPEAYKELTYYYGNGYSPYPMFDRWKDELEPFEHFFQSISVTVEGGILTIKDHYQTFEWANDKYWIIKE